MKTYRTEVGPFSERVYYDSIEIESICCDELRKVDLYPQKPSPTRIDRFIEKRFGLQPTYEVLPAGLLGFTKFGANGPEAIVVTSQLDEQKASSAERRLRTTLAHEAGHCLLHAHLFALNLDHASSVRGESKTNSRVLCRSEDVFDAHPQRKRNRTCWWEFQANQAMSALLLPAALVRQALSPFLVESGAGAAVNLPSQYCVSACELLSEVFDVNPIVSKIRLSALCAGPAAADLTA